MSIVKLLFGSHEREELIRTIDSVIALFIQILQLAVTVYGLHFMMTHSR